MRDEPQLRVMYVHHTHNVKIEQIKIITMRPTHVHGTFTLVIMMGTSRAFGARMARSRANHRTVLLNQKGCGAKSDPKYI